MNERLKIHWKKSVCKYYIIILCQNVLNLIKRQCTLGNPILGPTNFFPFGLRMNRNLQLSVVTLNEVHLAVLVQPLYYKLQASS